MDLKAALGDFSFVAKVNVRDLSTSRQWYQDRLGLQPQPEYDTPTWAQFQIPTINASIGLNLDPTHVGTAGAVSTFVVADIVATRNALIGQDIVVTPIIDVGHGVKLAFFQDPSNNSLGLRQNG